MSKSQAENLLIYPKKVQIVKHLRHMEGCLRQMRKRLKKLDAHIRHARETNNQLVDAPLVFTAAFFEASAETQR